MAMSLGTNAVVVMRVHCDMKLPFCIKSVVNPPTIKLNPFTAKYIMKSTPPCQIFFNNSLRAEYN